MDQFIYRGENERNFELVLTKAVGYENIWYDDDLEEPLGIIIVAKNVDDCWIANEEIFLGWKIEHVPVAASFVKGYNEPFWKVLMDNGNAEDFSSKYIIYLSPDGNVVGETLSSELIVAKSLEEFKAMSLEEIEKKCYSSEMSGAR